MPAIYEVRYAYDGEIDTTFYATKAEAEYHWRQSDGLAELIARSYDPTKKGIAELLNQVAS
jgi:hypothetical protein